MANPAKAIDFFDSSGSRDSKLAFVMGGALIVAFIGYRLVLQRPMPAYKPTSDTLDGRVIIFVAALIAGIFAARPVTDRANLHTQPAE